MTPVIKFCTAFSGILGAGSAVGVPLALHLSKEKATSSENILNIDQSSIQQSSPLRISYCGTRAKDNDEEIDFGRENISAACGVEASEIPPTAARERYTELFNKMGNNKKASGEGSTDYGKRNCEKEANDKGMFTVQVGGKEYLGLCDYPLSSKQWIIVENKNSDQLKVRVCSGDCFVSKTENGGNQLSFEERGKGIPIQFRKRFKK